MDFGFSKEDIKRIEETYNSEIIETLKEDREKNYETLLFLKKYGFTNIKEMILYRIEILLESTEEVKKKITCVDKEKLLKVINSNIEILDKIFI